MKSLERWWQACKRSLHEASCLLQWSSDQSLHILMQNLSTEPVQSFVKCTVRNNTTTINICTCIYIEHREHQVVSHCQITIHNPVQVTRRLMCHLHQDLFLGFKSSSFSVTSMIDMTPGKSCLFARTRRESTPMENFFCKDFVKFCSAIVYSFLIIAVSYDDQTICVQCLHNGLCENIACSMIGVVTFSLFLPDLNSCQHPMQWHWTCSE